MYTGWGLASGTQCAMSLSPFSLWYLTVIAVPSSDACASACNCRLAILCASADLAQRYPDEFPAYRATRARLIPGVHSKAAHALAWAALAGGFYLQINCGAACGMT